MNRAVHAISYIQDVDSCQTGTAAFGRFGGSSPDFTLLSSYLKLQRKWRFCLEYALFDSYILDKFACNHAFSMIFFTFVT